MRDFALTRFNALVHELTSAAPKVDAEAIASMARWLHSQPAEQRELLLQAQLGQLAEVKAMRDDPGWSLDAAQAHRIGSMLAYVAGALWEQLHRSQRESFLDRQEAGVRSMMH